MAKIFISYRREDTSGWARGLYDKLEARFGADNLFMDIDNRVLQPGDDFVRVIEESVAKCEILIALIGRRWSTAERDGRRRLLDERDYVRLEIVAALRLPQVRVIPVLFDQAAMPDAADLPVDLADLVRRQAVQVSDSRFHNDVDHLTDALERLLRHESTSLEFTSAAAADELKDPDEGKPADAATQARLEPLLTESDRTLGIWEVIGLEHFSIRGVEPDPAFLDAREAMSRGENADAGERLRAAVTRRIHQAHRSALCFSGGGLRSVAFGLGVLQGLARRSIKTADSAGAAPKQELLFKLDYLSTVSGGSYLGGWFSRWAAQKGPAALFEELASPGFAQEPEPVRRLRRFMNYFGFAPLGNIPIVFRNILLNGLAVLPLLATLTLLPVLLSAAAHDACSPYVLNVLLYGGLSLAAIAVMLFAHDFPSARRRGSWSSGFAVLFAWSSIVCAALLSCWYLAQQTCRVSPLTPFQIGTVSIDPLATDVVAAAALGLAAGVAWKFLTRELDGARALRRFLPDGMLALAVLFFLVSAIRPAGAEYLRRSLIAGPAIALSFELMAFTILSGTLTRSPSPREVDWWKRACSILGSGALAWLVLSAASVYSGAAPLWLKGVALLGSGGLSVGLGASISGRRAARLLVPAVTGAALIAFAGLLLLLSDFDGWLVDRISPQGSVRAVLLTGLVLTAVTIAMWARVNVNTFSAQATFADHVTRIFEGAAAPHRGADPFTGYSPSTDILLRDINYRRPLHLLNMAANVTERSEVIGQKFTRWLPFTMSRLHSGSLGLGYRESDGYLGAHGATLGKAVAVSGAVANRTFYEPSRSVAALMTLFNRRYGLWAPNPAEVERSNWRKTGPRFLRALLNEFSGAGPSFLRALLDELSGLNTTANRWLHLTDGGYFDNLGLFEMVLRRCHTIILVDATADPELSYRSLGDAIRKIGVELNITIDFLSPLPGKRESSARHCAIARIVYEGVDAGARDGWLIYLKPTLNGNEPPDIRQYSLENAEFPFGSPHERQFDETQFESYRRLGLHTMDEICGSARAGFTFAEFVQQVLRYCG